MKPTIKTDQEISAMRQGGRMLAQVLDLLQKQVEPGMSERDIAELAKTELGKMGGQPAFLNYQGFPDVICVSVNDEVVHGVPGEANIADGDILSLDFGVVYQGMITDAAISMIVGSSFDAAKEKLVNTTKQALNAGIDKVKNGIRVGDISAAIELRLRERGLGVIEHLVGHGVGHKLHEPPEIPNFGPAGQGPILKTNMTVAIEPMATLGGKNVKVMEDGWTVKTADNSLSAHFEHTVLVTEDGGEILTQL